MPCRTKRFPRLQRGAVLAVTLLLLTIVTLVGVAAARQVNAGLRVTATLRNADLAFQLAASAVESALQFADDNPALLPPTGTLQLSAQHESYGRATRAIRHTGDGICPAPFTGTRSDFEIQATAETARGARSHQRLTFFVCREICGAGPCAESAPQVYSWFETRADY